MTLVLCRSDLERLLGLDTALTAPRDGFRDDAGIPVSGQRVRVDVPGPGTATVRLPGSLPGVDAASPPTSSPAATPARWDSSAPARKPP